MNESIRLLFPAPKIYFLHHFLLLDWPIQNVKLHSRLVIYLYLLYSKLVNPKDKKKKNTFQKVHKAINQRQHAQLRTPSFFFATINLPESTIFFRFPTSAKCRFYITISQFYFSEKLIVSTNFEPNNMSNFVLFRCMRNLTFRSTSGE